VPGGALKPAGAPDVVLLARYGELTLKGQNRRQFEQCLARNARAALAGIPGLVVERLHDQLRVRVERRHTEALARLGDVFGIAWTAQARAVPPRLERIVEAAREELERTLEKAPTGRPLRWRVHVHRSDKRFPMTSPELGRHVADAIAGPHTERLQVDLVKAESTLGIQVDAGRAYVYGERRAGLGGLPVGTLGKAVCLLSGGIDSPVAAWMTLKRGCEVVFAAFHSYPYLGEALRRKIERLVRALARYQPHSRLYVVPFTAVQEAIRDSAPSGYRTILYRRMMQRIACGIAARERALAVVTGESLGQVASQTLENLTLIEAASTLPVLRPLIGFDKQETIALARRIGTFAISAEPEPDCCTVFQPPRPVIRGSPAVAAEAEERLAVDALVAEALARAEVLDLEGE
jgi:thiamine biosynthesis protein ThiI